MNKRNRYAEKNDFIAYLEHKENQKRKEIIYGGIIGLISILAISTIGINYLEKLTIEPIKKREKEQLENKKEKLKIDKEQKRKNKAKYAFNEWYKKQKPNECKSNDLEWNQFVKCQNHKIRKRKEHRELFNY